MKINDLSEIRIERASIDDLPKIAALARVVWLAHYPGIISTEQIEYMLARMYHLATLRRELEAEGIRYDRLVVGEETVAFSAIGSTAVPGEMKLHKLYVHPERQRHGYGSRLLEHVLTCARAGGFHTLILAVNKQNAKAINAYRKNGFEVRESVVNEIGGGFVMDDYVMARRV